MTRVSCVFIAAVVAACGGGVSEPAPSSGTPSGSSSGGTPVGSCDAPDMDVAVTNADYTGYPPYAIAGCSLVYVSSTGALVLRDLGTGAEETLAPATESPRRPSASPDVIAWESDDARTTSIKVRLRATGETKTIGGDLAKGTEPRVSGTSVAFTAWITSTDADVWLYDATTGASESIFNGPAEQRFADVSPEYVVATDFSEDPDGIYNGQGTSPTSSSSIGRRAR